MSDSYVTIEQYQFLPEAQAVRIQMESLGISAQLADAETVSTDWALGNAIGYIKLQVRQSQAQEALTVLEEFRVRRKARDEHPEDPTDTGRCLACNAQLEADQTQCPACGWSYADMDALEIVESPESELETQTSSSISESEPDSVLENLRSLKPLFVMLLLIPIVMALAVVAFYGVMSIFR